MASEPLITIGITCYREGDWLRECWQSVLNQTDDRWEALLLMDGGSDDETQRIFNELEHPKLRKYASPTNVRHGVLRNQAIELTRTPYHFYLDADDLLFDHTIELVLGGFEKCPEAAVVCGDIEWFGGYQLTRKYPREISWDYIAQGDSVQGSGSGYRVDVWRQTGGHYIELADAGCDFDFNIGLLEAGFKRYHVGEVIYKYRKYPNSLGTIHDFRVWKQRELMVKRHPRFFADSKRTRDFLSHGYAYSFRALYERGDLRRARDVARRALLKGCAGEKYWPMRFLTGLPLPVFRALVPVWRLRHKVRPGAPANVECVLKLG